MKLNEFIQEFKAKKGFFMLLSSIIEKIGGLFLFVISTHLISKSEFGFIIYANSSLDFIIPFIGFGIHQGLIRYGSLSKSQSEKKQLYNLALKKGLQYSLFLIILVVVLSPFITINKKNALLYLLILSFQFISLFLYEILRIYTRLIHLNKLYAQITNIKTITLIGTALLLTFQFQGIGYTLSLSIIPFVVSLWFMYRLNIVNLNVSYSNFNLKEFITYGMFASFSGVLSQLLFAVDLLLIGNLLTDETLISQYKAATIVPYSFLILSVVFVRTSFVKLANKSTTDKQYIKQYYLNYLKLFSILSIALVVFFYFFSDAVFLLFGKQYNNDYNLMFIFSIGIAGALLFRTPLGNILSAVGWVKVNTLNAFISLVLNIILNYYFITTIGLVGAAIATTLIFWFSGAFSLVAFIIYIKKK